MSNNVIISIVIALVVIVLPVFIFMIIRRKNKPIIEKIKYETQLKAQEEVQKSKLKHKLEEISNQTQRRQDLLEQTIHVHTASTLSVVEQSKLIEYLSFSHTEQRSKYDNNAKVLLGLYYYQGLVIEQDLRLAEHYWDQCASDFELYRKILQYQQQESIDKEQATLQPTDDVSNAQIIVTEQSMNLANTLVFNRVEQSVKKNLDDNNAKALLGLFYYQGFGVVKDEVKAKSYWEQCAYELALYSLAIKYYDELKQIDTQAVAPTTQS